MQITPEYKSVNTQDVVDLRSVSIWSSQESLANNSNKKPRVNFKACEGNEGEIRYEAQVPWSQTSSTREVVEGCLNLAAAFFMIRPWDYQAMHDLNYIAGVSDTSAGQRAISEEFINKCLTKYLNTYHTLKIYFSGQHPIELKDTLETGEYICSMHAEIAGFAKKVVKVYGSTIDRGALIELHQAREELATLRQKVTHLNSKLRNEGNSSGSQGGRGGGNSHRDYSGDNPRGKTPRTRNPGGATYPPAKRDGRACKHLNIYAGCTDTAYTFPHKCNSKNGDGSNCEGDHPIKDHH